MGIAENTPGSGGYADESPCNQSQQFHAYPDPPSPQYADPYAPSGSSQLAPSPPEGYSHLGDNDGYDNEKLLSSDSLARESSNGRSYSPYASAAMPASRTMTNAHGENVRVEVTNVRILPRHNATFDGQPLNCRPTAITCPHCHEYVTTDVTYRHGLGVWLTCAGLCLFGCILCSWIPCCIDNLKDCAHTCPNCNKGVGNYRLVH